MKYIGYFFLGVIILITSPFWILCIGLDLLGEGLANL